MVEEMLVEFQSPGLTLLPSAFREAALKPPGCEGAGLACWRVRAMWRRSEVPRPRASTKGPGT